MFSARNRKNLAARQDIHFLWYPRAMYIFISLIKILFILVCAWLCVLGISFAVSFSNWTAKVFGESIRGRTKDYSTGPCPASCTRVLAFLPAKLLPHAFISICLCFVHLWPASLCSLPACPSMAIDRLQATHRPLYISFVASFVRTADPGQN